LILNVYVLPLSVTCGTLRPQRHELRGAGEVVVGEQRLEDRLLDRSRIEVVHGGRIEAGFRATGNTW
jgi:hypothetical protein